MKTIFSLLALTILAFSAFGQALEKLYPITKGNLWGYIDKTGTIIIKPTFYSAGQFSEGLAPVRLNGTYGYIDNTGTFAIPPKYDLALPFKKGQAKVFIDSKPFFIDKTGNITFQHNYKRISSFEENSYAIAVTKTDKYGIINRSGNLIGDTVYKKINSFVNGLAVVYGFNHLLETDSTTEDKIFEVGVIDSAGNWIVAYGRYQAIENFKNHYARVEVMEPTKVGARWYNHEAVIDEKGNQKFIFPAKEFQFDYSDEGFYDDVAVVSITSVDIDTVTVWSSDVRTDFRGVINTDGKILFSDTSWTKLTPFTFNRAFVLDGTGKWKLINKSGNQVGDSTFIEIMYERYQDNLENLFADGVAYVKLSKGWVIIDTSGVILTAPLPFDEAYYNRLYRVGQIIFFEEDISIESQEYSYRYGFWNSGNKVMVNPTYHAIDMNNFNDNLIYVMQDGRKGYITPTGRQIWKEEKTKNKPKRLNIDYMNRGYYYASSKYKKELAGFGGWANSNNQSKPATPAIKKSHNQLQVIIDPNKKAIWAGDYQGMKLFVVNTSKDSLYFEAQDSRLYLKIQAQDKNKEWKDIEYLPSSWCGNSYHTLFLAPNQLWEFSTPVYQGEFKTKMRAQLLFKKNKDQKVGDIIYSNEVDGYINPGQFWNKQEYYPSGLMDPYND